MFSYSRGVLVGLYFLLFGGCSTPQNLLPSSPSHAPAREELPASAFQLGIERLRDKDGRGALSAFNQCLVEKPQSLACLWERGWAHFVLFDFERALDDWQSAANQGFSHPKLAQTLSRGMAHAEIWKQVRKQRRRMRIRRFSSVQKQAGLREVRLWAVGDTMLGSDFPTPEELPPAGENPLALLQSQLAALAPKNAQHWTPDLKLINYEGTICDGGRTEKCAEGSTSCYAFRTPLALGRYLKDFGVHAASLANNHALDFGEQCRTQTEQVLTELGIGFSGRPGSVWRSVVRGRVVLFAAFHSAPGYNQTLDTQAARAWIRSLKQENPQALIVVSFHGGAEGVEALRTPHEMELFHGEKRGDVRAFAHAVVDGGADLVMGSGPHVVRGLELYKRKLIAYSLGNFATVKTFNLSGFNGVSVVMQVDLDTRGRLIRGRLYSIVQQRYGEPILDPEMRAVDLVRALSALDFGAKAPRIARDGSFQ